MSDYVFVIPILLALICLAVSWMFYFLDQRQIGKVLLKIGLTILIIFAGLLILLLCALYLLWQIS